MLLQQSAAQAMKRRVTVTHFTTKIIHTYIHTCILPVIRKFYLLKNILA